MRESGGVGEGEAGVGQLFTPLAIKGKCSRARSSSRAGSLTWERVNACSSQMRNISNTQTRTESCGQRFSLHCANSNDGMLFKGLFHMSIWENVHNKYSEPVSL